MVPNRFNQISSYHLSCILRSSITIIMPALLLGKHLHIGHKGGVLRTHQARIYVKHRREGNRLDLKCIRHNNNLMITTRLNAGRLGSTNPILYRLVSKILARLRRHWTIYIHYVILYSIDSYCSHVPGRIEFQIISRT